MPGTTIIAEVGLAHEGSLALAHDYVDACAAAGVDAIKFQLHLPEEGTATEPFRSKLTVQDATRQDYWRRTGFHLKEWSELGMHVRDTGRTFMLSTFCEEAVHWAKACGCTHVKVPSGQMNNLPMIETMASLQPALVYLSLGLSTAREIRQAMHAVTSANVPLVLMHTTTAYPTPPNQWRLPAIEHLRHVYRVPVGFSDHSGTVTAGLLAVGGYRACAVEVHVTFDRRIRLPDVRASLTFPELGQLVEGVRAIALAAEDQFINEVEWEAQRRVYMPSVVATRPLEAGTVLDRTHLTYKKAGAGPGLNWDDIIGRHLLRDVRESHVFTSADVSPLCVGSV